MNTKKQQSLRSLFGKLNKGILVCYCMLLLSKNSSSQLIGSANTIILSLEIDQEELIIQWKTNKEINTSFFFVEKSTDSIHYEVVQTIKAASSSMLPKTYETTLYSNNWGYYRVSLILMDGSKITSQPLVYHYHYLAQNRER